MLLVSYVCMHSTYIQNTYNKQASIHTFMHSSRRARYCGWVHWEKEKILHSIQLDSTRPKPAHKIYLMLCVLSHHMQVRLQAHTQQRQQQKTKLEKKTWNIENWWSINHQKCATNMRAKKIISLLPFRFNSSFSIFFSLKFINLNEWKTEKRREKRIINISQKIKFL